MRGRRAAGDRRAVVYPADQAAAIDVKNLLGAVGRNMIRKGDLKPPARFAVVLPRLDFFRLESRQREDEGRVEIVPHRVAAEISEMQIVPRGFDGMALKGAARILSILDRLSVRGFDHAAVGQA